MGKPKGAAQITAEIGFIALDGLLTNGRKYYMNWTSIKDTVTKVGTVDKATSVIRLLKKCSVFKFETKQLKYIFDLLNITVILTPKCHPEIAGRDVECRWAIEISVSAVISMMQLQRT